ncbi:MAG TPA: hypothetical protein VLB73_03570 [Patescibacteria group bacterium]|nr:hypothetical protein [Patescibacteria group bacterium]
MGSGLRESGVTLCTMYLDGPGGKKLTVGTGYRVTFRQEGVTISDYTYSGGGGSVEPNYGPVTVVGHRERRKPVAGMSGWYVTHSL